MKELEKNELKGVDGGNYPFLPWYASDAFGAYLVWGDDLEWVQIAWYA